MSHSSARGQAPPLDRAALDRLAIAYVGKYATTRAKLAAYLRRKLKTRGWEGDDPPPVDAIVARCGELGYVDDRAFAEARAAALTRAGYGTRRVRQTLKGAGIAEEDAAAATAGEAEDGLHAALAFARRRRIGPHATAPRDPDQQRRDLAAMLRAGHDFATARRVVRARIGEILVDANQD